MAEDARSTIFDFICLQFFYADKSPELCGCINMKHIDMESNKKSKDRNTTVKQRYVNILANGGFKAFFGDMNNKQKKKPTSCWMRQYLLYSRS